MPLASPSSLGGLRFAVVETGEYARAPEFRYLVSWVRQEAEAVFGAVRDVPADEPPGAGDGAPLLILDGRTLVARRSLGRMARALAEGAASVAPRSLASVAAVHPLAAGKPVYTLRGYERLEAALVADAGAGADAGAAPDAHDPVSCLLVAPGEAGQRAPREWLECSGGGAGGAARAGLCHRFADYYGQAREDVIEHLANAGGAPFREVLEVGCGRGATGRLLQERLGCRVTGVEINPVVARAAAEVLHRVVPGDVHAVADELTAAAGGPPFDALVALELFEHLTDQEGFLELARRLVRPGGRIVLSVPNVGHHAVVEDLLAGRWDYLPIGLLCYTHYRFFTRHTLETWLRRCGFRRFRLVPQETELPDRFRRPIEGLETDLQSLRTKGFFVLIDG